MMRLGTMIFWLYNERLVLRHDALLDRGHCDVVTSSPQRWTTGVHFETVCARSTIKMAVFISSITYAHCIVHARNIHYTCIVFMPNMVKSPRNLSSLEECCARPRAPNTPARCVALSASHMDVMFGTIHLSGCMSSRGRLRDLERPCKCQNYTCLGSTKTSPANDPGRFRR